MSTNRGPYRSPGNVADLVEVAFLVDRRGDVWRIVRDGGMAARITREGEIESAGITWLRDNRGPLIAFDPMAYHRAESERECAICGEPATGYWCPRCEAIETAEARLHAPSPKGSRDE